jgi:hypothetical protein
MASWNDVRRIALGLPGTSEVTSRGSAQWRVDNKNFAWERPLNRTDLAALGEDAPQGPIVGVRVADLGVKEALLADAPEVFFTIPHFDGYPAVLVLLDRIEAAELEELMIEAWLDRAPKRLATAYQERNPDAS